MVRWQKLLKKFIIIISRTYNSKEVQLKVGDHSNSNKSVTAAIVAVVHEQTCH